MDKYNKLTLLKWVGGKGKLLQNMNNLFPKNIDNYYELFVGGGSVLLYVLENIKNKNILLNGNVYAYDINTNLINFYKQIQSNPEELYKNVENLINEFNKCKNNIINRNPENLEEALDNKENYYYLN
jgi:DNA adenine methylase